MRSFFILLCVAGICLGQLALNNSQFNAVLNGNLNRNYWLLNERFEGPGYQYTWNQTGSTVDPADSNAPLAGTYSLNITEGISSGRTTNIFTSALPAYGFFYMRSATIPTGAASQQYIAHFLSGTTNVFSIALAPFDANNAYLLIESTITNYFPFTLLTRDAQYAVWWNYDGTNAELYFNASSFKPVAPLGFVPVNGYAINRIILGSTNTSSWQSKFDNVVISLTNLTGIP